MREKRRPAFGLLMTYAHRGRIGVVEVLPEVCDARRDAGNYNDRAILTHYAGPLVETTLSGPPTERRHRTHATRRIERPPVIFSVMGAMSRRASYLSRSYSQRAEPLHPPARPDAIATGVREACKTDSR